MTCKKIHKLVRFDVDILHVYIFSVDLHEMVKLSHHRYLYLYKYMYLVFLFLYSCHAVYIPDSGVNGIYLTASIKFYIT